MKEVISLKKIVPIVLVLIMAFAFSFTSLAKGGEEDVVVLPPVDLGVNEAYEVENISVDLDKALPSDVDIAIDTVTSEEFAYGDWPTYDEELLFRVEGYKNHDVYDKDIVFDAIQFIAGVVVVDVNDDLAGVSAGGGKITVTNYNLGYDTIKAILQSFNEEEYILITEFEYDPATGTLAFYVDDLGKWSEFFALIERGAAPATAERDFNATSPQTSNNSIHAGIILLITLSAAATTIAILRKARNHN